MRVCVYYYFLLVPIQTLCAVNIVVYALHVTTKIYSVYRTTVNTCYTIDGVGFYENNFKIGITVARPDR